MKAETFASAEPLPLRETIARAIYAERPYAIAESGGVMMPLREAREVAWADAPDWYRGECYDLADGIAGRLVMIAAAQPAAAAGDYRDDGALRGELAARMAPWGARKRIAFDAGTSAGTLCEIRAGRRAMTDNVAAALGYRRVTLWAPDDRLRAAVLDAAASGWRRDGEAAGAGAGGPAPCSCRSDQSEQRG